MGTRSLLALVAVGLLGAAGGAEARKFKSPRHFGGFRTAGPFDLKGAPVGHAHAPTSGASTAHLAGSTIAAWGSGTLVIDGDSGDLVQTDGDGVVKDRLFIGLDATQLVVDATRSKAYVVDRGGDRVVEVELARGLREMGSIATDAEPFGIALGPDRKQLLVTAVADRSLTAYGLDGRRAWSRELAPEPRGVALSPDGKTALVTFLTTGAVARVDLPGDGTRPGLTYSNLNPPTKQAGQVFGFGHFGNQFAAPPSRGGKSSAEEGRRFARNAFAARFVGHGIAVVPHQVSTPHMASEGQVENVGSYGGGGAASEPPVAHHLAFFDFQRDRAGTPATATAATNLHQPRALAYDGDDDVLYVAGYGSDTVMAVNDVSQAGVSLGWQQPLPGCGPNGMAVGEDGDLFVYCSVSREVVRLETSGTSPTLVRNGPAVSPTRLSEAEQRGREFFRKGGDHRVSTSGAMACASCHAEGRTDGLSWRIEGHALQTPLLGGRLAGAHPFKWDGQDPTLKVSLRHTVKRLGGTGITEKNARDLEAFLKTLPRPRPPSVTDAPAVARGKQIFEDRAVGCVGCHDGPLLTDGKRHDLAADLPAVDTPSLIGLAASAPYYHDGSARTLRALLLGNGSVHGMGRTSRLTDGQIDDLVAFLETL